MKLLGTGLITLSLLAASCDWQDHDICVTDPAACFDFNGPDDPVLTCEEFCSLDCVIDACSTPPADCSC